MNLPAVRLRNFPDLEAIVDADYGYARYAVALKRYDFPLRHQFRTDGVRHKRQAGRLGDMLAAEQRTIEIVAEHRRRDGRYATITARSNTRIVMPAAVSSCAADGIHIYRCENRNSTRL